MFGRNRTAAPATHTPRRGSDVETYIKTVRDSWNDGGATSSGRLRRKPSEWYALDEVLDDYRERADVGDSLGVYGSETGRAPQGTAGAPPTVPVAAVVALSQGEPLDEVASDYSADLEALRSLMPAVGRTTMLDPVLVAKFLAWCDTAGEHEGQPWAAMVDTLRETQP